jgi:hypothetical protein
MSNPMIRIHNTETDEVIDREMNAAELKQLKADQTRYAAKLAEAEAKAVAKTELLQRLGITAEEAALLLG